MALSAGAELAQSGLFGQVSAIVEAQYRSLFHFYGRGSKSGAILTGLMTAAWYAMIAIGSVAAGILCARTPPSAFLHQALAAGLLFIIVYWQFIPLLIVSTGVGLDLKRLVVYPVSRKHLFVLDLALRVTSGVEALMMLTGSGIGLLLNPALPLWAPLAFVPFIAFNLCFASGLRAVFGRLMAGRRTRELSMLGLVLLATLPQIVITTGWFERYGLRRGWTGLIGAPWTLTADWASGRVTFAAIAGSFAWVAVAAVFGWLQFRRTLRFDQAAAAAAPSRKARSRWNDVFFEWPSQVFRDPLGALVEKELRSLSRTPRFRVVFIMGFTFSLLIWLPMMAASGRAVQSGPPGNFLALMMGYALLMLGESCFWNTLGFDRAAAQFYFLAPMPFADVLKAKNVAAGIVVALEWMAITTVAFLVGLPLNAARVLEAAAVGLVLTLLLLAAGNLGSVYAPRAADPSDVWRKASAGKTQAFAIFVSPVLGSPVLLAYLARYAFDSEWAFWGVMAVVAVIASVAYFSALDSAVGVARARKEEITATLSRTGGPMTA